MTLNKLAPPMLFLDLSHTSHTRARTGVQRVCRSLFEALQSETTIQAITSDPYERRWRKLRDWELANLKSIAAAPRRGAQWPWQHRVGGIFRRHFRASSSTRLSSATALIVPEIFSARTAAEFSRIFSQVNGPRVAVFHDAIALKYPELTASKTVARFPIYLRELLAFDAVAAVSEDSRQTLLEYWAWLGVNHPPVRTISLGTYLLERKANVAKTSSKQIQVLSVGSIEGRKNHGALLDACERLWADGLDFELRLIGLAQSETGRHALERIDALKRAGRRLRYDGPVSEEELERAYETCAFTVYPSLMEGFGLPVLESIQRGKPCICSGAGALGEAAKGGGCLTCETMDSGHLTDALRDLLTQPVLREKLAAEARVRPQRTWRDHAQDLLHWIEELRDSRS